MKISLIAAMDKHRVIGGNNQMLWHLPADFAWFKQQTMGKPVVMGRKTHESIGMLLPGRLNVIVSRSRDLVIEGAVVVSSIEQALAAVKDHDEVMIIGGETIYRAFLPLADCLYLTFVDTCVSGDAYFPKWSESFSAIYQADYAADEKNAHSMRFCILEK